MNKREEIEKITTRAAVGQILKGIENKSKQYYEAQTTFTLKTMLTNNEIVTQEIENMPEEVDKAFGADLLVIISTISLNNNYIIEVLTERGEL